MTACSECPFVMKYRLGLALCAYCKPRLLNNAPSLFQVNASPSLSGTTKADRLLKCQLVHDTISLVVPNDWTRPERRPRSACMHLPRHYTCTPFTEPEGTPKRVGSLHILYDETRDIEKGRAKRDEKLLSDASRRNKRHTMMGYMDRPAATFIWL